MATRRLDLDRIAARTRAEECVTAQSYAHGRHEIFFPRDWREPKGLTEKIEEHGTAQERDRMVRNIRVFYALTFMGYTPDQASWAENAYSKTDGALDHILQLACAALGPAAGRVRRDKGQF